MASSSKVHAEREPLSSYEPEGFDVFTLASLWERFISEIEATCRLWLADGPNKLVRKNALQVGFLKYLYKLAMLSGRMSRTVYNYSLKSKSFWLSLHSGQVVSFSINQRPQNFLVLLRLLCQIVIVEKFLSSIGERYTFICKNDLLLQVLHYLETLRPHQLLEQMVCTAFRASADILNQTSFGDMNRMKIRIEQLYRIIGSTLKSLKAVHEDDRDDLINDLVRLCRAFHQAEQLLIFAASIHHKLLQAPRLCQGVFYDYHKFYARLMGTSSIEISNDEEFHVKKTVRMHERHVASDLFRSPTANQSWIQVLSMGNLLDGHEPILREVIFSVHKKHERQSLWINSS